MEMSEFDICKSYRDAGCTNAQIKILADLNCCGVKEIARILDANGESVDKRLLRSGRKVDHGAESEKTEDPMEEEQTEEVLPPKAPISVADLISILDRELSAQGFATAMVNGGKLRTVESVRVYDDDMNVRVTVNLVTDDGVAAQITIGGQ